MRCFRIPQAAGLGEAFLCLHVEGLLSKMEVCQFYHL